MNTSSTAELKICTASNQQTLSPEQKRFNALIEKITKARQTLAVLKTDIAAFEMVFVQEYQPRMHTIDTLKTQFIKQIDQAARQTKLSKRYQTLVGNIIYDLGADILEADSEPALKAIFTYWCDIDIDQVQMEESARAEQFLRDELKTMMGIDLPDDFDISQPEQSMQKLEALLREHPQFAAADAEEAVTAEHNHRQAHAHRRQAAKRARVEQQEKEVSLSIREVYRKLASQLHPDREQDEQKRSEKNALMQQVNAAYEARDLLQLLELQLRLEHIDQQHLDGLSKEKLLHYLQVLTEQEQELRFEIRFLTDTFRHRYNISEHGKVSAQVKHLKKDIQSLKQVVTALEKDTQFLQHTGDIKMLLTVLGYA